MTFKITDLPEGAQALPSLLVPKVKRDEDYKDLYELKVRRCAHGNKKIFVYQDAPAQSVHAGYFRIFTSFVHVVSLSC